MRISDWSSDVCSSDLQRRKDAKKTAAFIHVVTPVLIGNDEEGSVVLDYIVVTGYIITDEADQLHAIRDQGAAAHARQRGGADRRQDRGLCRQPDRTSVVSGKSVSVRVDLDGRRVLKKKNIIRK